MKPIALCFRASTLTIILLLNTISLLSFAQRNTSIKGVVINAETNESIAKASVFINNTTYGTICDESGNFQLSELPSGAIELTVTAIGFETQIIKADASTGTISVGLLPKVFSLDAVSISAPDKDGWTKYGTTFLESFIGYSDFAKQCKLLNKNALDFYFDKDTYILTVRAKEPLKIKNEATGYNITYWLDDFTFDYVSKRLYFRGNSQYENIATKKEKKKRKWNKNRMSAYNGSLYHFMRSVYAGNVAAAGFEVRALLRTQEDESGMYFPKKTDTISFNNQQQLGAVAIDMLANKSDAGKAMSLLKQLKEWADSTGNQPLRIAGEPAEDSTIQREFRFKKIVADSANVVVQYFEYPKGLTPSLNDAENISSKPKPPKGQISLPGQAPMPINDSTMKIVSEKMLGNKGVVKKGASMSILFKDIVPIDSFRTVADNGKITMLFNNYLHITYVNELTEDPYYTRVAPFKNPGNERQESIINLTDKRPITITVQGNFYDSYSLMTELYWAYEKLDKMLPLDYQP